ncbi:MAG: T9SS type A sorting domain-containing protein [Saprospiraceae bacterium]|nr:T9SS type A sorting domain-containing protein [Saprospiraceae bacterium]
MNTRHLFLACALCIPLGLSAQIMTTTGSATSLGANTYQLTPAAGEILDNGIDDNCNGLVDILVYCTPYVSYACEYFWITNVTLAGINNSSDCGSGGYTDFTALSASLEPGATYPILISLSGYYYPNSVYSVYVDWSRDGDFDDSGEKVAFGYSSFYINEISANISVPGDATGSYTMRVTAGRFIIYPCKIYYGEAEDYTIFVCPAPTTYYRDSDGDGYGNSAVSTTACAAPNGFVANNGDCDDGDASIKPGAAELCDGKDNDCDGQIDESSAISSPWTAVNVGAEAQGSSWFDCTNGGTFTLNAKGYTTNTTDVQHTVFQTLCGNGDIIARVASISTQGGWAGIQMRESASQGAKKFTIKTQLNTNNRREARTATNGPTNNLQIQRPFTYNWLRITRSGNVFAAYLSVDGVNWGQPVSSTTMTMNSCIQVGLFVESINNTTTTQAVFANVNISGAVSPLTVSPDTPTAVAVYPNPTTGEMYIDLPSYAGRAVRLEIYNLQGQLLHFAEIPEVQTTERLDLSAYPSGMYLVKVKSEGLPDVSKRLVLN